MSYLPPALPPMKHYEAEALREAKAERRALAATILAGMLANQQSEYPYDPHADDSMVQMAMRFAKKIQEAE